jgi:MFS family permease
MSSGVVIGIALACTSFGTIYGALSRIVPPERRSWALGLAGSLGGLGQFAMVPLAQELLQWLGVTLALVGMGFAIALLAPAARLLDDRAPKPETRSATEPAPPEQTLRAALRLALAHRGFWLLNIGFFACGFQVAFIAAHLPAYLLDRGLGPRVGVAALAIIALANVASMMAFGAWGDVYRRKHLLAVLYLARTAVIALFLCVPLSPLSVYLFCAAIGFLWLGAVPLTNGIVSGLFGVRYIATLFGFVFVGHQLGSFLGIWLGGLVFDRTHSYHLLWTAAMALGVMSAALHLFIDDRPVEASGLAAPQAA